MWFMPTEKSTIAAMEKRREGQCQCGNIRYRLIGEPLTLYICHCLHCQKQSSSAFGMSLWINRDDIEFLSGELEFWTTKGDSGATKMCAFCGNCGSRIYHASDDDQAPLSLKAGTLNDTSWLRPVAHIWTKRAQPWVSIDQESDHCYDEEPPSDEELRRLWRDSNRAE